MIELEESQESPPEVKPKRKWNPETKAARLQQLAKAREIKATSVESTQVRPVKRLPPELYAKAVSLRLKGLTYDEIAQLIGVSHTLIVSNLQPFEKILANPETIQAYRENEADLIDAVRQQVLAAIATQLGDSERVKKLDIMRLTNLFGVLFDKMRLLRGQSTSNIHALSKLVIDAHSRRVTDQSHNPEVIEQSQEPLEAELIGQSSDTKGETPAISST